MAHLRPWIPRLRGRDPCRHGVRIVPPGIQWRRPWPWARTFDHSKPTTCPSHGAAHPGCGMALDGGGMPLVPWSLSLFPSVPASPSPGSLHPSAQVLAIKRAHLCRLLSPSPWPWRRSMVGPRRRRRRERWEPTRMDANRTHPIRAGSIASSGPAGRVPPSWTRRSCLHGDVARAQSFRPRACLDDGSVQTAPRCPSTAYVCTCSSVLLPRATILLLSSLSSRRKRLETMRATGGAHEGRISGSTTCPSGPVPATLRSASGILLAIDARRWTASARSSTRAPRRRC